MAVAAAEAREIAPATLPLLSIYRQECRNGVELGDGLVSPANEISCRWQCRRTCGCAVPSAGARTCSAEVRKKKKKKKAIEAVCLVVVRICQNSGFVRGHLRGASHGYPCREAELSGSRHAGQVVPAWRERAVHGGTWRQLYKGAGCRECIDS